MVMACEHCIIAGAPRSATTSLYNCLSGHVQFASSSIKQTLFFLNADDEGTLLNKLEEGYGVADYLKYFPENLNDLVTLEATPDYIYSSGVAQRIYDCLGEKAFIIFVLRDPVDRLVSCYHHEKLDGSVSGDVTVDEFIAGDDIDSLKNNVHVQQGEYSKFISDFYRVFNRNQICVLFTEDLASVDTEGMQLLAERMDVDLSSVASDLRVRSNQRFQNKSESLLRGYRVVRRFIIQLTSTSQFLNKMLSVPIKMGSMLYRRTNRTVVSASDEVSMKKRMLLKKYYSKSNLELAALTGREIPWAS